MKIENYPERNHPFQREVDDFIFKSFYKPKQKVMKIDPITNKILKIYNSVKEAGRDNNIDYKGIWNCFSGKQKTCAGFKWEKVK